MVDRVQLIYTTNGGEFQEEWSQIPATLLSERKISATLPVGTTHYVINLIDQNNFLVSYPDVEKSTCTNQPSDTAQAVVSSK